MKEHEGGKSERKRETSAENPRPLGVAKKGERTRWGITKCSWANKS